MTFGEKLSSLRKQAGMTQKHLAEQLGVSRQAIAKWEAGSGLPDIDNLAKIAALFHVSIDDMLDYQLENVTLSLNERTEAVTDKASFMHGYNEFILKRFEGADAIYSLSQELNWNIWQQILHFFLDVFFGFFYGIPELSDFIQKGMTYCYYIEEGKDCYLAIIQKKTLMIKRLTQGFVKRHLVVDCYRYTKLKRIK